MSTVTPYRSTAPDARDGFGPLLHAEWTKFRTVPGWVIGMMVAVLVTAGLGVLVAEASNNVSCQTANSAGGGGPVQHGAACAGPVNPLGPGGEPVQDEFYFVRQSLAGHGSLTVRLTSLTGRFAEQGPVPGPPVMVPWSKAGIIIKDGTRQGSAYAAMMLTGGNGVRMQWNYTADTPGLTGTVSAVSPRWLRLTRDGDTITGYDSADGTHWTRVGTVALTGLPPTVQAGLFVTSPRHTRYSSSLGAGNASANPTQSTASFDHVSRTGTWLASAWTAGYVDQAAAAAEQLPGGYHQVAGRFTVTGSGDIAPLIAGPLNDGPNITVRDYLLGTFAGLIAVAVVATMFMTAEYRRGLIRTTLAASPGRGRVLAAKALVIGSAAFVAGLAAAAGAVFIASAIGRGGGDLYSEPWPAELRIIGGTAALIAVAAVLTLAVATIVRRSATAILIVILTVVIPFVLSAPPGIPAGLTDWLLRITPAAAFALQQPMPQYYQVQANYTSSAGYFPLAPWTGFAVLCGWTALALVLAAYLLHRRDA
jgi:ABC-type transport system involved in multi-copper enzyme maturation permease subunit